MTKFKITSDNNESITTDNLPDYEDLVVAWRKWKAAPERSDAHEWNAVLEAAQEQMEETWIGYSDSGSTVTDVEAIEEQASPAAEWNPPTIEEWHAIRDAIATLYPQNEVTLEGGGAAATYIKFVDSYGRIILFGCGNETWGGETYANQDDYENGRPSDTIYADSSTPNTERDPETLAQAFIAACSDVCIAGNPAMLGICGHPDCVCKPDDRDPAIIATEKFNDAIDTGEKAFWRGVAAVYPEITTGDLHPHDAADFRSAIGKVINAWLLQNREVR